MKQVQAKKILLTGATGILGSHALNYLREAAPNAQICSQRFDIRDPKQVEQAFAQADGFDLLFHFAAKVLVREAADNPLEAYATNVTGTLNLVRAARDAGSRFVYCSTGHVYPPGPQPMRESDPVAPASVYAKSKRMGEILVEDALGRAGLPYLIGRIFSTHDPHQPLGYLRADMQARFDSEDLSQPFAVIGADGMRDFLTSKDAASLLVELGLCEAQGIVNIASGNPKTLARFVQELAPVPLKLEYRGSGDQRIADVSRLKSLIPNHTDFGVVL